MISEVQTKQATKKQRVLVVEDSDALCDMLRFAFSKNNLVYTALDTKSGWETFLNEKPDIVFIDINFPDGNGHDLARMIKNEEPTTYVVMATGSHHRVDKLMAAENHVDGFLVKPFHEGEIRKYILSYAGYLERCQNAARARLARKRTVN